MSPTLKGIVRNGRVELEQPIDLPEGTEVYLTSGRMNDDLPLSPTEIDRVLNKMQQLQPLDITNDESADLDEWERKTNQYGIDHFDNGIEDVFR